MANGQAGDYRQNFCAETENSGKRKGGIASQIHKKQDGQYEDGVTRHRKEYRFKNMVKFEL